MTSTNLEELKRAAEAATPGPWRVCSDLPALAIGAGDYRVVQTANQNNYRHFGASERWMGIDGESNAAFIALANPATILSLLAENDRLRSELEAERERNEWRPIDEKSTFIEWLRSWVHRRDDKWITHRTARLAYEEFVAARAHFQSQEASDGE